MYYNQIHIGKVVSAKRCISCFVVTKSELFHKTFFMHKIYKDGIFTEAI